MFVVEGGGLKGKKGALVFFFFFRLFSVSLSSALPYLRQVLVDGVQRVGLFPCGEQRRGIPSLDALRRGGVL